jgi:hypothetical protein
MKKFILLTLVSIFLAGCLESEQEYYINPDGSGKVVSKTVLSEEMAGLMGAEFDAKSPEELAEKFAQNMLGEYFRQESGDPEKDYLYVSDLQYGQSSETGDYYVNMTVYFSDINQVLQIGETPIFGAGKNEKGQFVFAVDNVEAASEEEPTPRDADDDEELDLKTDQLKAQLEASRMSADAYMKGFKLTERYHFAGKIAEQKGFELKDGTLVISTTGKDILTNLDRLLDDREKLKKLASKNMMTMDSDSVFLAELVFGNDTIHFVGEKDESVSLYDFSDEIEKAKVSHKEYMEKLKTENPLGSEKTAEITVENMPEIKSVKLYAIECTREDYRKEDSDQSSFVYPSFSEEQPGTTITLFAELTNEIAGSHGASFEEIYDDKGNKLESVSLYLSSDISSDRKAVMFKGLFKGLPGKDANYFKNIKGTLRCQAMNQSRLVELGELPITEEGKSENGILTITDMYEMGFENESTIQLEIKYEEGTILDVKFYDRLGTEINTSCMWLHPFAKGYKANIRFKQNYPDIALVKAVIVDGVKDIELPFETGPIDFSGKPAAKAAEPEN